MAYAYSSPYIWPMLTYSNTARSFIYTQLLPLLQPFLLKIMDISSQSPALGVVFLLASIYIGYKVLTLFQRVMGFFTYLMLRLSFWGAIALLVAGVWQRGLEQSVNDAVSIGKILLGKWTEESQKYNQQGGGSRMGTQRGGGRNGGGGGWF